MPDPALNEHNRRRLAELLREIMASDPYPDRPTIPFLLMAALRDAGYWEQGGEFRFETDPKTGRVVAIVPQHHDDGTPWGEFALDIDPGGSFDRLRGWGPLEPPGSGSLSR